MIILGHTAKVACVMARIQFMAVVWPLPVHWGFFPLMWSSWGMKLTAPFHRNSYDCSHITVHLHRMAFNSTKWQLYPTSIIQAQWKIENLLVSWVILNTLAPAPFNTSSQNFKKHFVSLTTPILIEDNGSLFTFVTKSRFSSDHPAGRRWFVTGLQMFACKVMKKIYSGTTFTILSTSFTIKQGTRIIFLKGG
jgi:hypothetical protein